MFHVEHSERLAQWLEKGAGELHIPLDKSHIGKFLIYLKELTRWNAKINLTSLKEDQRIITHHFLDSLSGIKAFGNDKGFPLLDVGCGAGFPGVPLKIANPHIQLVLLDPSQKKTAFLRHLIGVLELDNVMTIPIRIQGLKENQGYLNHFPYIVSRALDVDQILPYISPTLTRRGQLILFRTKPFRSKDDVTQHRLAFSREIFYELPFGFGKRVLTILKSA